MGELSTSALVADGVASRAPVLEVEPKVVEAVVDRDRRIDELALEVGPPR